MTFAFQPTLLALPQAAAVVITVAFAIRVWGYRKDTIGASELFVAQCFTTIWSLAGALEFCSGTLEAKILFSQISYIGVVGAPWAGFRFAYIYTGVQRPLPRWFMPVTLTWGGLIILAAFTNSYTGLMWREVIPIEIHGEFFARYERGPAFWFNIAFGYSLTLGICGLFVRQAFDLGGIYRGQSLISALAIICPWIVSAAYILRIGPLPEIDHTPVGFAIGNALFTWNLLNWKFLDLSPVATRTLFARMTEPVLVIDTRQRISQTNKAATDNFNIGQKSIGHPISEVLGGHPEILAACQESAERPNANRNVRDDLGRWWNVDLTALTSGRGVPYGKLCVLHEITALVEARKTAEHAHHVKGEFIAHVSHDLRTPLHAILVLSEILKAGQLTADQRSQLGTLHEAGQALLRLVNNLLDMNRMESGVLDLADTRFLLEDVLRPVVELLQVPARLKDLELTSEIEPGLSRTLRGDPDRLRQILFNLGGNAVKFTERGRIVIRASQPVPGMFRITVSDTGPGLPAGIETTLFEPFVRGAVDRKKEGSGLGLSIVRRLAEAMGGTAFAENGPNGGAIFTVDLPIVDNTPAGTEIATRASLLPETLLPSRESLGLPNAETGNNSGRNGSLENHPAGTTEQRAELNVLLVDDDPHSLTASAALLAHCGAVTETTSNGQAALDLLALKPFDLVILDGQMPGLDGIETTRRLRAFPKTHFNHGIPVLGLTADPSQTRREEWRQAGAAAVLTKPSSVAELSAALSQTVPHRSRGTA